MIEQARSWKQLQKQVRMMSISTLRICRAPERAAIRRSSPVAITVGLARNLRKERVAAAVDKQAQAAT